MSLPKISSWELAGPGQHHFDAIGGERESLGSEELLEMNDDKTLIRLYVAQPNGGSLDEGSINDMGGDDGGGNDDDDIEVTPLVARQKKGGRECWAHV